MHEETYHDREWLTDIGTPSTPSIVSFSGGAVWESGEEAEEHHKIEIASCRSKVTLHRTADQSEDDWQRQVTKLHEHIGRYLEFLRTGKRK